MNNPQHDTSKYELKPEQARLLYPEERYAPVFAPTLDGEVERTVVWFDGSPCDSWHAWNYWYAARDKLYSENDPAKMDLLKRILYAFVRDSSFPLKDRLSTLVPAFYWEQMPARAVADALEVDVMKVYEVIGTWPAELICPECGERRIVDATLPIYNSRPYRRCKACQQIAIERMKAESEAERLAELDYSDYLKTAHWQSLRIQALERAGYRCQVCNSPARLEVHHRTYERRGAEHLTDLTVLCAKCHSKFHEE